MSDPSAFESSPEPRRLRPVDRQAPPMPGVAVLSTLVGREAEIAAVYEALRPGGARLVTLTGPGGVGKTRLALRAGSELEPVFPDGVQYVFLASVRESSRVPREIALALDIQEPPDGDIISRLRVYLASKRMLLVLDNLEQVAEAGPAISDLLRSSPEVSVLATSRMPLAVYGERTFAVPPLTLTEVDAGQDAEKLPDAIRLFVDRARAVDADFSLDGTRGAVVADICRRLDGLPLAIELAAARLRVLSLPELRERLDPLLPLLTSATRDVPDRLRTMRNAIAWSYELLDERARVLFRRLAVFAGGFTLEAAAAMVEAAGDGVDVVDQVGALAAGSLLVREEGPDGHRRFRVLETIREYGLDQLVAHGEAEDVRERHAAWVTAFLEETARHLTGEGQRLAILRIDAERENIEAALGHALSAGDAVTGLRICASLWLYWNMRGMSTDGSAWTSRMLELGGDVPEPLLAAGYFTQGILRSQAGDAQAAKVAADRSLALAEGVGDPLQLGLTTYLQGLIANRARAWSRAEEMLGLARTNFREADQPSAEAAVLNDMGRTAYLQQDFVRARERFDAALAIGREQRVPRSIAMSLHNLGNLATDERRYRQAARQHLECLAINLEYGDEWHVLLPLIGLVRVAAETQRTELAARLTGVAESLVDLPGVTLWDWSIPEDYSRTLDATRAILANDRLQAEIADGRRLTLDDAIAEAEALTRDDVADEQAVPLTPRERDVLRLLVAGKPDRKIGDELFISHRTVQTHITSLYRKLGVHSRTEAIVEASRLGFS